ncbi:MAG: helix-turn-helix transcriptional regulator [Alphaproteobacteria bacterium]|nr:helix-turn-helix transcriptional regulator [Alphaproteobacteria bacterium]
MVQEKKERVSGKKGPNPIDIHVGRRVRIRRVLCGLSQTALAEQLGLTFQQLQKYESGANRISASRLWQIAQILDVPIAWFFMGIDDDTERLEEFRTKRETLELVRNIGTCPPEVQKRFRALLHSISEHTQKSASS